jgi:DNA gyrase subunit B
MTDGRDAEPPYDDSGIEILAWQQAIRQRAGMYIGDTTRRGLHQLVFELVDNSIDEATAGRGTEVRVTLHADGSATVADDGSGFLAEPYPNSPDKRWLEVVLTQLGA